MPADSKQTRHVDAARGPESDPNSKVVKEPSEPVYPRRFGSYELLALLGRGGMGEVSLARRRGPAGIDQLCVLKQVRVDTEQREDYARRFLDEARVMAQLSHTHVCHVVEVGEHAGTLFLALEHIQGLTLDRLLVVQPRPLPTALALHLLTETLEGLDYAHRHKHPVSGEPLPVVHRDVSPHNVMVTFEGEVKLIDFGLATSALKVEHTEKEFVMGKVAYMSPEQARGDAVDARTDQYAAAIMGTELLLHERYYGERPRHVVWGLCGTGTFRPERFSEIPAPLRSVLDRALCAERDQRFPDCRAFKAALHDAAVDVAAPRDIRAALREHLEKTCAKEQEIAAQLLRQAVALTVNATSAGQPAAAAPAKPASEPTSATGQPESTEALVRQMAPGIHKVALAVAVVVVGGIVGAGIAGAGLWPRYGAAAREKGASAQELATAGGGPGAPAARVRLRFTSAPAGAQVSAAAGGPVLGVAPFTLEVERGDEERTYRATLPGFDVSEVKVTPDETRDVRITLTPAASTGEEPAAASAHRRARAGGKVRGRPQRTPKSPTTPSGPLDKDAVVDPY